MASAAGVARVRATLDLGSKSSKCAQGGEPDSARITHKREVGRARFVSRSQLPVCRQFARGDSKRYGVKEDVSSVADKCQPRALSSQRDSFTCTRPPKHSDLARFTPLVLEACRAIVSRVQCHSHPRSRRGLPCRDEPACGGLGPPRISSRQRIALYSIRFHRGSLRSCCGPAVFPVFPQPTSAVLDYHADSAPFLRRIKRSEERRV